VVESGYEFRTPVAPPASYARRWGRGTARNPAALRCSGFAMGALSCSPVAQSRRRGRVRGQGDNLLEFRVAHLAVLTSDEYASVT